MFRGLTKLGYSVFFIGHEKESISTDANGVEKVTIRPSLSNSTREVIAGMADIFGYAHQLREGEPSVLTLRNGDGSIQCGCRFKYIDPQIPMNYQSLVNTIQKAIDKEAEEHSGKFVTDERNEAAAPKTYDYDALKVEFKDLVGQIMTKNQSNGVKITSIVEKYLGKGKKVSDTTPEQGEFIYLIVSELKEELL